LSVVPPSPFVQGEGCFSAQAGTHSLAIDAVPSALTSLVVSLRKRHGNRNKAIAVMGKLTSSSSAPSLKTNH